MFERISVRQISARRFCAATILILSMSTQVQAQAQKPAFKPLDVFDLQWAADRIRSMGWAKERMEALSDPDRRVEAMGQLVAWLTSSGEEGAAIARAYTSRARAYARRSRLKGSPGGADVAL